MYQEVWFLTVSSTEEGVASMCFISGERGLVCVLVLLKEIGPLFFLVPVKEVWLLCLSGSVKAACHFVLH